MWVHYTISRIITYHYNTHMYMHKARAEPSDTQSRLPSEQALAMSYG